MTAAFTPGLVAQISTTVRRTRTLPIPGEILVSQGETVSADTVVARATLQGDMHILRIAESLGIEAEEVIQALRVEVDDSVEEDQLLAEHSGLFGLFQSRYRSPAAGTVEFIAELTGHVGLRMPPRELPLAAYISGTVVEIDEKLSVTIETPATYVQGIFGVGGECSGEVCKLSVAAAEELRVEHLPSDCKGKILFGGTCPNGELLRTAADAGATGLITGGITDEALSQYLGFDLGIALTGDEPVSMTVIVTEGFGALSISERVLEILDQRAGSFASLNGATQVRAGALRPEIIIPTESVSETARIDTTAPINEGLQVGAQIRLIRYPYFGLVGEVAELPHEAQQIETGAKTRVLRARLSDGRELTVPRANVELF